MCSAYLAGGRGSPQHMRQHGKFENSDALNRNFPKVFGLFFIFQELAPEIPFSVQNQFLHQALVAALDYQIS